jgi:hypothetical protein
VVIAAIDQGDAQRGARQGTSRPKPGKAAANNYQAR